MRRWYRLDGLQLRMRVRRRKHIALHRGPAPTPTGPTEPWSMDFVHDALADGRPFRVLTVVDQWSRQSPILEVASSMSGLTVGAALERAIADDMALRSITVDHGTEFMLRALEDWAYQRGRPARFHSPWETRGKRLSSSHFTPTFPIWLPRIGQILHPLALDRMFLSPEPHLLTPATAT